LIVVLQLSRITYSTLYLYLYLFFVCIYLPLYLHTHIPPIYLHVSCRRFIVIVFFFCMPACVCWLTSSIILPRCSRRRWHLSCAFHIPFICFPTF